MWQHTSRHVFIKYNIGVTHLASIEKGEHVESMTEWLLGLLALLTGSIYVYDRTTRDRRFEKGEKRMKAIEKEVHELKAAQADNAKQHAVLREKVDGLQQLVTIRFDTLSDSTNRLEDMCANIIQQR